MKLAGLLLKYEADIGPPERCAAPQLGEDLPEVIVPGALWAKWLERARLEVADSEQGKHFVRRDAAPGVDHEARLAAMLARPHAKKPRRRR